MNRTVIKIEKDGVVEEITLQFGTWVIRGLIQYGYSLTSLSKEMQDNPFDFLPVIIRLAAINATDDLDEERFSKRFGFDWLDQNGIDSPDVKKILNAFVNSLPTENKKKEAPKQEKK